MSEPGSQSVQRQITESPHSRVEAIPFSPLVPGRGSGDEGQYIHALALLKLCLHQQFIGIFPYLSPLLRMMLTNL